MSQSEKNKSEAEPEKEGEALLIKGRVEKLEEEQKAAQKRDEDFKDRQTLYSGRVAMFTGFLVLASLITNVIYLDMSCTARKTAESARIAGNASAQASRTAAQALRDSENSFAQTLNQMQAQTSAQRKSAAASVIQADAARDAAKTTSKALAESIKQATIENRPILWVTNDLATPITKNSIGTIWEWKITNYGKTPALDVDVEQRVAIRGHPTNCWQEGSYPHEFLSFTFPSPITPNSVESWRCMFPPTSFGHLSSFDQAILYRGELQIRITLNYKDIDKISHTTFFCLQNAGWPINPTSKAVFCDSPQSYIDTKPGP